VAAGPGPAMRLSVRRLLAQGPEAALLVGVCGGLDPSLRAGDVILAQSISQADDVVEQSALHIQRLRKALRGDNVRVISGRLVTVDHPVTAVAEKTRLWNEASACAVDMESFAFAQEADAAGVPWAVLRAVVDPASTSLPPVFDAWSGDADEARIRRWLLAHPWDLPAVVSLGLGFRQARRQLRRSIAPTLDQLSLAMPASQTRGQVLSLGER
ncbi:MAG TPA: hypothetical protein VFY10_07055, partial [Dehalococcoidia bacterium]|nr:hypothetical protein [Dehalococcoidia bacterium]